MFKEYTRMAGTFFLLERSKAIFEIIGNFWKFTYLLCWENREGWQTYKRVSYKFAFGDNLFKWRLVVWDSFRSHISSNERNMLYDEDYMAVVSRATQNAFKLDTLYETNLLKQRFLNCMMTDLQMEKGIPKNGIVEEPNLEIVCSWVKQAWGNLSKFIKFIKSYGITNSSDGMSKRKLFI